MDGGASKDVQMQPRRDLSKSLALANEDGMTPEPEKLGDKVRLLQSYDTVRIQLLKPSALLDEFVVLHPHTFFPHVVVQVLPDLTTFMDSLHSKMMQVHTMTGKLELEAGGAANPATKLR